MADERETTAADRDTAAPPMPAWVKYLLLALLAVLVLAVLAMLLTGGEHGPGRHGALAASVIDPRWLG